MAPPSIGRPPLRPRPPFRPLLWPLVLALFSGGVLAEGLRLRIDTHAQELQVIEDGKIHLRLRNIAIGRFGASPEKRRGDGTTPTGEYRISGLRRHERFHFFVDIDYPSVRDARRGYDAGLISMAEKQAIERAHRRAVRPPQNTALGGYLGIHGVGAGDRQVHRRYNWTRGCVALDDWQIDELRPWLRIGMPVEIL